MQRQRPLSAEFVVFYCVKKNQTFAGKVRDTGGRCHVRWISLWFTVGGYMTCVPAIATALAFHSTARHKTNPRQSSIARTGKARGRVGSSVLSWLILILVANLWTTLAHATTCTTGPNIVFEPDNSSFMAYNLPTAEVDSALDYVAGEFCQLFTNTAVSLTIPVTAATTDPNTGAPITLGHNDTPADDGVQYSFVQAALQKNYSAHMNDLGQLELTNLTNLKSTLNPDTPFSLTAAEEEALGLPVGTSGSSLFFNPMVQYTFDPKNRSVSGKMDFIGVIEHELTEALGRVAGLNAGKNGENDLTLLDLFRFKGPGQRSFNNTTEQMGAYFSLHNGNTMPKFFNVIPRSLHGQIWVTGKVNRLPRMLSMPRQRPD
jgi:hypothetical protein